MPAQGWESKETKQRKANQSFAESVEAIVLDGTLSDADKLELIKRKLPTRDEPRTLASDLHEDR